MERTDGIFEDLLNIEVNTIVKHSMTAEKMPSLPFALLDIISDYGTALAELRVYLGPYFATSRERCWELLGDTHKAAARKNYEVVHGRPPPDGSLLDYVNDLWPVLETEDKQARPLAPVPAKFSMSEMDNGWDTFERLRIAALEACTHITEGHDRVMLDRIVGSCARLKYILQGLQQRPPPPPKESEQADEPAKYATLSELIPKSRNQLLSAGLRHKRIPRLLKPDDLTLVRKAWEVGVERVLMQTSVQIDGDVVTRISQELLREDAANKRELIMEAHKRSVEIGLSHWRALVQTAVELVTNGFSKLFR